MPLSIGVEVRTTGHFSQKFQKRIQNAYNVGLDHVIACDLDVLQYLQHIYDICRQDRLNIWPIYWSLSYRLIRVSTIKIPDIYINLSIWGPKFKIFKVEYSKYLNILKRKSQDFDTKSYDFCWFYNYKCFQDMCKLF